MSPCHEGIRVHLNRWEPKMNTVSEKEEKAWTWALLAVIGAGFLYFAIAGRFTGLSLSIILGAIILVEYSGRIRGWAVEGERNWPKLFMIVLPLPFYAALFIFIFPKL